MLLCMIVTCCIKQLNLFYYCACFCETWFCIYRCVIFWTSEKSGGQVNLTRSLVRRTSGNFSLFLSLNRDVSITYCVWVCCISCHRRMLQLYIKMPESELVRPRPTYLEYNTMSEADTIFYAHNTLSYPKYTLYLAKQR